MNKTEQYLRFLRDEIHSTIFATVDENGDPVTCPIDIMLAGEDGLFFLTAKGKTFYDRLIGHPQISLTGMKGDDTMSAKSITVKGKVRELGPGLIPKMFSENPYMEKIYPKESSRAALTAFQIYEGEGEFFDLTVRPVFREIFTFGGAHVKESGYFVTGKCTRCGACLSVCPQGCIDLAGETAVVDKEHCIHCGMCVIICPEAAVIRK